MTVKWFKLTVFLVLLESGVVYNFVGQCLVLGVPDRRESRILPLGRVLTQDGLHALVMGL